MDAELIGTDLILDKAVLEVRYTNSLLFGELPRLNQISKKLIKDFPQPQNTQNCLILNNPTEFINVAVYADRTAIDSDSPTPYSTFKNRAIKSVESVVEALDVDDFNRVGLRLFFNKYIDSAEESMGLIKNNFLKINESIFGKNINNPIVQFTTSNDNYSFTVTINGGFNYKLQLGMTTPIQTVKNTITFDIDVFTFESLKTVDLNSFINNGFKDAKDIAVLLNKELSR